MLIKLVLIPWFLIVFIFNSFLLLDWNESLANYILEYLD